MGYLVIEECDRKISFEEEERRKKEAITKLMHELNDKWGFFRKQDKLSVLNQAWSVSNGGYFKIFPNRYRKIVVRYTTYNRMVRTLLHEIGHAIQYLPYNDEESSDFLRKYLRTRQFYFQTEMHADKFAIEYYNKHFSHLGSLDKEHDQFVQFISKKHKRMKNNYDGSKIAEEMIEKAIEHTGIYTY